MRKNEKAFARSDHPSVSSDGDQRADDLAGLLQGFSLHQAAAMMAFLKEEATRQHARAERLSEELGREQARLGLEILRALAFGRMSGINGCSREETISAWMQRDGEADGNKATTQSSGVNRGSAAP